MNMANSSWQIKASVCVFFGLFLKHSFCSSAQSVQSSENIGNELWVVTWLKKAIHYAVACCLFHLLLSLTIFEGAFESRNHLNGDWWAFNSISRFSYSNLWHTFSTLEIKFFGWKINFFIGYIYGKKLQLLLLYLISVW